MSHLPPPIDAPVRILMGPGPSDIHPSVLSALAAPTVGHLDPSFLQTMDEVQHLLRRIFQTQNEMTMAISDTRSTRMENGVVNFIEPGDRFVACVNGVFGGRMADVADRCGAEVTRLERGFGEVFTPEEIECHRVAWSFGTRPQPAGRQATGGCGSRRCGMCLLWTSPLSQLTHHIQTNRTPQRKCTNPESSS